MARYHPFGLFVLVLYLVACVCAHADVSEAEAKKAAEAAKESAKKVFEDIKGEVKDSVDLRKEATACKKNAKDASEEATKAAKGNPEAEAIAQKAKHASDEVLKLYAKAYELEKKYRDNIKPLLTKAEELIKKGANDLYISSSGVNNYTKIKEDADTIKAQVEALNKELQTAMGSFGDVADAQNKMLKPATEAQLARYHVDAIVAAAKFETLLESSESNYELIEQKRDEIIDTVQNMKTLYDNSPKDLSIYISDLQNSVDGGLKSASYSVDEAKKAKTRIMERKAQADEALVKVKAETDAEKAKQEAGNAKWAVRDAEEKLEVIKKALESATSSASNALRWKRDAVDEINKKTKKPDDTQDNSKVNLQDPENVPQPVKDTTEIHRVIEPKKPTITTPEQLMNEKSVQDITDSYSD